MDHQRRMNLRTAITKRDDDVCQRQYALICDDCGTTTISPKRVAPGTFHVCEGCRRHCVNPNCFLPTSRRFSASHDEFCPKCDAKARKCSDCQTRKIQIVSTSVGDVCNVCVRECSNSNCRAKMGTTFSSTHEGFCPQCHSRLTGCSECENRDLCIPLQDKNVCTRCVRHCTDCKIAIDIRYSNSSGGLCPAHYAARTKNQLWYNIGILRWPDVKLEAKNMANILPQITTWNDVLANFVHLPVLAQTISCAFLHVDAENGDKAAKDFLICGAGLTPSESELLFARQSRTYASKNLNWMKCAVCHHATTDRVLDCCPYALKNYSSKKRKNPSDFA